jgi:hypothetical protein
VAHRLVDPGFHTLAGDVNHGRANAPPAGAPPPRAPTNGSAEPSGRTTFLPLMSCYTTSGTAEMATYPRGVYPITGPLSRANVGWAGFEPATSASRTGLQPCYQVLCDLESTGWRALEPISHLLWRKMTAAGGMTDTLCRTSLYVAASRVGGATRTVTHALRRSVSSDAERSPPTSATGRRSKHPQAVVDAVNALHR